MEAMTFDELQHLLEGTLENADEAWKVWAYQCITQLADAGEPFTADEVHLLLEPYGRSKPQRLPSNSKPRGCRNVH